MLSTMDPEWIDVPGGSFRMGGGPRDNENPRHEVRVLGLRLARAPVTREEYQAFLDATRHPAPEFWEDPSPIRGRAANRFLATRRRSGTTSDVTAP